jgi:hypothetical protein
MKANLSDVEKDAMWKTGCHLYDIRRMTLSSSEMYRLQRAVDDMEGMLTEGIPAPLITFLTRSVGDPVFRQMKVLLQDAVTQQIRHPI